LRESTLLSAGCGSGDELSHLRPTLDAAFAVYPLWRYISIEVNAQFSRICCEKGCAGPAASMP
jgi:hypothetical protein